jgi:hypothetical protein
MQQDIHPGEIDCVFCWRTVTGEVAEGARDTKYNGSPVRYRPDFNASNTGLHTSVAGRTCRHRPTGFLLREQGSVSRMACIVSGYVTHPVLVPARNGGELRVLQDAAQAAVLSGEAREWSLAVVHAGGRKRFAIHVAAEASVVADLSERVRASWTVRVEETVGPTGNDGSWFDGVRLRFHAPDGHAFETLLGDSRFGVAALPRQRPAHAARR